MNEPLNFSESSFTKAFALLKDYHNNRIKFGSWKQMPESKLRMILFSSLASGGTRGDIVQEFMVSKTLRQISHENLTFVEVAALLRVSKIRFPNQKARRLMTIKDIQLKPMLQDLSAFSGRTLQHERWVRIVLKSELFGMGFKEISNFLKWSGFSKFLAVLDSINLGFMKSVGAVPSSLLPGRLSDTRVYYDLENWQNDLAERLGITVSELDNLIVFDWVNSRNR